MLLMVHNSHYAGTVMVALRFADVCLQPGSRSDDPSGHLRRGLSRAKVACALRVCTPMREAVVANFDTQHAYM
jgi:hypothetical protein